MKISLDKALKKDNISCISAKIKQALKDAKERGVMLGRHGKKILSKANKRAADEFAKKMIPVIKELQAEGYNNIRTLTAELNSRQISTYYGDDKQWHLRTVNALLLRISPARLKKKPQPIKWAGGKRGIMKELKKHLPDTFNNYYEPFFGGGALFFELQPKIKKAYLSDINEDLMTMYKVIQSDPERLITALKTHARNHNANYYYQIRAKHDLIDSVEIAARLIYLNKTCYNGLFRVNKKGEFNTAFGDYLNPEIYHAANMKACSKALQGIKLKRQDYRKIRPRQGDFVYFDPPYHKINETSFTAYSEHGFGEREQIKLAKFCRKLHQQGVKVMVSNSDTNFIMQLYSFACFSIHHIKASRMINRNPLGRTEASEIVLKNY